jgi:GNAT superfamily N-acetyltransferase
LTERLDPQEEPSLTYAIREAAAADCRGLAEVQVDSYRTTYAGFFPRAYIEQFSYAEQEQDWLQLLAAEMHDILLVAVSADGQVIGYVLARDRGDLPGYDSEIAAMHVRRSLQKQGVGKALLAAAAVRLAARGCQRVMLWTLEGNPVRAWYERLGGKLIGEKSYDVDDWRVREVAYGWEDIAAL